MKNLIQLAFGIALLVLPAQAQNPAPSARMLKIRGLTFGVDQTVPQLYAHFTAAQPDAVGVPVTVKSYLNHEAEQLTVLGDEVVFTVDASRASLKTEDKQVAKLKIPANLRSAILIFLPAGGTEQVPKCRVLTVNDNVRAFPRGSLNVINLSHTPLRIELEKKPFDFKSGEMRLIENPPVGPANASDMVAYTFRENQWQQIGASSWPHPGSKRVLQIAFDNGRSQRVEMRGVRDIAVRDD